ncbi:MAG TPA: nitrilase-related carbon-nitrogen hydrolase [Planctomycetota bacterium]|nr:nitrilase-related carbon-nitrogen hydrolase [Planctomycetota bacterium]
MNPHLAAIVGGLLLFASDHPLHVWPLQFVAFVPLVLALSSRRHGVVGRCTIGLAFALAYLLPLLAAAGTSLPILVAAAAALLEWTLLPLLLGRLLARGPVLGAFAAAAAVTAVEVAIWHLVPMFGSAQCFARVLSAGPALVAFAAYTGVAGVVFVQWSTQALVAAWLRDRRQPRALAALGIVVALVAALDVVRWQRSLGAPLRVAAVGWAGFAPAAFRLTTTLSASRKNPGLLDVFELGAGRAAAAGAQLVVTPEVGWSADDRASAVGTLGKIAHVQKLAAAFGVWMNATDDNWILFFDAAGELRGEYRKTHLIPWLEDYAAGDGTLLHASVGRTNVGGMICQDDSFSDLARAYSRDGARLLAVPTNDWDAIREFHLENSVFRAIECGYGIVRAASNGVSALVTPRGEVVARADHCVVGGDVLIADLPCGDGSPTLYARLGDGLMFGLSCVVLAFALARRRAATA